MLLPAQTRPHLGHGVGGCPPPLPGPAASPGPGLHRAIPGRCLLWQQRVTAHLPAPAPPPGADRPGDAWAPPSPASFWPHWRRWRGTASLALGQLIPPFSYHRPTGPPCDLPPPPRHSKTHTLLPPARPPHSPCLGSAPIYYIYKITLHTVYSFSLRPRGRRKL